MVDYRRDEETLNRAFKALSDPTRRRIVQLLREAGELRVSDVAAAFEMSLNGVSKHLKVLEKALLVARRIEGKTHWLRADSQGMEAAWAWIDAETRFWTSRLDALELALTPEEE